MTEAAAGDAGDKPAGDAAAGAAAGAAAAAGDKPAGDKPAGDAAAAAGEKPAGDKPSSQGKTGGESETLAGGKTAAAEPAKGAPDKYELVVPEGLETGDLEGVETTARQLNLTNEQAQAVADALPVQYDVQRAAFRTQLEAHPEVGGDHLQAAEENTSAVLDKFLPAGTPEGDALRRGLNVSGYGNWPPLVLLLHRIGKAMGEDGVVSGKAGGPKKETAPQQLYDHPSSKAADAVPAT